MSCWAFLFIHTNTTGFVYDDLRGLREGSQGQSILKFWIVLHPTTKEKTFSKLVKNAHLISPHYVNHLDCINKIGTVQENFKLGVGEKQL